MKTTLEDPTRKPVTFLIRAAENADLTSVESLLVRSGLPLDGLKERFPSAYVVARVGDSIIGVAGLEQYGDAGLLRSVAVEDGDRGAGVGRALVSDRLARARELAIERVFLLTTTAAAYFRALGFESAERARAPLAMQRSPEFAGACPASAECLSCSSGTASARG